MLHSLNLQDLSQLTKIKSALNSSDSGSNARANCILPKEVEYAPAATPKAFSYKETNKQGNPTKNMVLRSSPGVCYRKIYLLLVF